MGREESLKHISELQWSVQRALWGIAQPGSSKSSWCLGFGGSFTKLARRAVPITPTHGPCHVLCIPFHHLQNWGQRVFPNQNDSQLGRNPHQPCHGSAVQSHAQSTVGMLAPEAHTAQPHTVPSPCPVPAETLRTLGIIPAKPQSGERSGRQSLLFFCLLLYYLCPSGAALLPPMHNVICLFSMSASFFFCANTF